MKRHDREDHKPSNSPTPMLDILADLEQAPAVSAVPIAAGFEAEYRAQGKGDHVDRHVLRNPGDTNDAH